jgi:hypothetical protein
MHGALVIQDFLSGRRRHGRRLLRRRWQSENPDGTRGGGQENKEQGKFRLHKISFGQSYWFQTAYVRRRKGTEVFGS